MKSDRNLQYEEFTIVAALDQTDQTLARRLFDENPELDQKTVSRLLDAQFMKRVVNKNSKKPLQLSPSTTMALIRNKINAIIEEHKENNQNGN